MIYNPVSTYRIQFSSDFTFKDFGMIIPYLHRLGVKTIYASPVTVAVPGSTHGYDVTDPLNINPDIGTLEELRRIHQKLKSLGMGWIQDIVPNHMAFSVHNPWIRDILEKGKGSEYSDYFDINWNHPDEMLNGKLMLPVLGKHLEESIDNGEIKVVWNNRIFVLKYYESEFPLNYDSWLFILNKNNSNVFPDDLAMLTGLFNKAENNAETGNKVKELFSDKYVSDKNFRDYINENLRVINSNGNFLNELIRLQHYAPVYWKESERKRRVSRASDGFGIS